MIYWKANADYTLEQTGDFLHIHKNTTITKVNDGRAIASSFDWVSENCGGYLVISTDYDNCICTPDTEYFTVEYLDCTWHVMGNTHHSDKGIINGYHSWTLIPHYIDEEAKTREELVINIIKRANVEFIHDNKFIYSNIFSEDYGLEILHINTKHNVALGGNLEYTTVRNNKNPRHTIVDRNYTEPLEYEIEFISPIKKLDDKFEEISNWLLNQYDYRPFLFRLWKTNFHYANCIFTNAEKIEGYGQEGWGIYGIKATMKIDSSFIWKEVNTTCDIGTDNITIQNDSSVRGYTYPIFIIKTGNVGGDITLQNVTDNNRLIIITNSLPNDTITISSYPKKIKSLLNSNDITIYNNFNKNFPRLIQGKNSIGIIGDVTQLTCVYQEGKLLI